MICERIVRKDNDEYDYKYVLEMMSPGKDTFFLFKVYKKAKKNSNANSWNFIFDSFPKEWQIMFSRLKDDMINELNCKFNASLMEKKNELSL